MRIALGLGVCDWRGGGTYTPPAPSVPVITSSSITGTPEDGETLTANRTVTGYPSPAITYQWQASGTNISGQTAQTIVLDATGMGLTDGEVISCEITATNTEGSDTDEPTIAFVAEEGGPVLDPALTAPIISLAVAGDAYPPEFDAIIDETAQADTHGYSLFTSTTFEGMAGATPISAVISDAQATANAITGLLSGIVSGLTYIQLRIYEVATGNYSARSNLILHGDVVAPTITSGTSYTPTENQAVVGIFTADKLCYWSAPAGSTFVGSQPSVSLALHRDSNFDTEAQDLFSFDVTATALNGLTDSATISVDTADQDEIPTLTTGTFTDVTGAALSGSTPFSYTVAGLGGGVIVPFASTVAVTKNGAGSFTSGTATNTDVLAGSVPHSTSYSTETSATLTVGAGADTLSVTTEADPLAVPEMTQVDSVAPVVIQATTENFGTVDLGAEDPTRVIYIGVAYSPGAGGTLVSAMLGGVAMTLVSGHVNGAGFFRLAVPTGTSAEFILTLNNADSYGGGIVVWRYVNGTAAPTDAQGNAGSFDNYPRSVAATTPTGGFTLAINYAEDTTNTCTVTNAVKGTQETANFITVVSALRTGASAANVTFSGLANGISNAQATLSVGP